MTHLDEVLTDHLFKGCKRRWAERSGWKGGDLQTKTKIISAMIHRPHHGTPDFKVTTEPNRVLGDKLGHKFVTESEDSVNFSNSVLHFVIH